MMDNNILLPHLFRTEYAKIVAVLGKLFGIDYLDAAQDIASDTFLSAAELWPLRGVPDNPRAWLYAVAKNKTKNYLKHHALLARRVVGEKEALPATGIPEADIDLSPKNISDSLLAMMFAVANPCISEEAQVSLSLNVLCGFSIAEIADAFLTNKEVVYKRLQRAKERLQAEKVRIEQPTVSQLNQRLDVVLTTLYLLFSEGYYSSSQNTVIRKELCAEAMRLLESLTENEHTDTPACNALLALMCFHASRFDARTDAEGNMVLYAEQDTRLWDAGLIRRGESYLNKAAKGTAVSKYHLEAGIAWWHTVKEDRPEKWENILQLYNQLLIIEYSPMAALNRTYALSKANGKEEAIAEAEKLGLTENCFYYTLLGNLYTGIDDGRALQHYRQALSLAKPGAEKAIILTYINELSGDTMM